MSQNGEATVMDTPVKRKRGRPPKPKPPELVKVPLTGEELGGFVPRNVQAALTAEQGKTIRELLEYCRRNNIEVKHLNRTRRVETYGNVVQYMLDAFSEGVYLPKSSL